MQDFQRKLLFERPLLYSMVVGLFFSIYTLGLWVIASEYEADRIALLAQRETEKLQIAETLAQQYSDRARGSMAALAERVDAMLYPPSIANATDSGITATDSAALQDITGLFIYWMKLFPFFDHLRLLAADGDEVIRINNRGGGVTEVPPEGLQNKAHRNYFINGMKGNVGELQVGRISLTIENRLIEKPYFPTSRLIIPMGRDNGIDYLFIGNFDSGLLFSSYRELSKTQPPSDVFVIRPDGVLVAATGDAENFVFADQRGMSQALAPDLFPGLWQATLDGSDRGTLIDDSGLYVFGPLWSTERNAAMVISEENIPLAALRIDRQQLYADSLYTSPLALGIVAASYALGLLIALLLWRQQSAHYEANRTSIRLSRMFEIISHELRTPASTLDMLIQSDALDARERPALEAASKHLLNVIGDLRATIDPDYLEELKESAFSLTTLVRDVERQVAPLFAHDQLGFHFNVPEWPEDGYLSDPRRLRLVLINLLHALHHYGNAGNAWLSVTREPFREGEESIHIILEDDGDETYRRMSSPVLGFGTQSAEGKSASVIFQVAQRAVASLGGKVSITPSARGGARFEISLVMRKTHIDTSSTETRVDLNNLREAIKGREILFIEDDRVLADLCMAHLHRDLDVRITYAQHGTYAIDLFLERRFDLLLVDQYMPAMNGKDVILKVRETDQSIPILTMTAQATEQVRDSVYTAGANALVEKPLTTEHLLCALAQLETTGKLNWKSRPRSAANSGKTTDEQPESAVQEAPENPKQILT